MRARKTLSQAEIERTPSQVEGYALSGRNEEGLATLGVQMLALSSDEDERQGMGSKARGRVNGRTAKEGSVTEGCCGI